jgi:hypothetical protein
LSAFLFRSTEQIADELVAREILRREYVLEMQHLDPKWVTALYLRAVCVGAIVGYRPAYG